MLGSEASIACTNLSSRAKTIRSSVNLTNKTYVRVTEFYLILVYFRSLLFSFSPRCFDLLSLLFLVFYPVRLLLQSHSRAAELFIVRLLDTVANDFYSSSLFSSLLPPVAVDWWARNDNFPSLSFCCCFFLSCLSLI